MHGAGRFHHREDVVIDSIFCNNLAHHESDTFVNPFMNKSECQEYIACIARGISEQHQAESAKLDKVTVHRADDAD